MKVADMDVRPAQGGARAQPQRAPALPLARLLLLSRHKLCLLVLLLLSMSACIIPMGPEFRDPPGEPNASPIIRSAKPDIGWVAAQNTFEISVEDPNAEDELFLRWIIDYPPFTLGTSMVVPTESILPLADGSPRPFPESRNKTFSCASLRPLPRHQIMVIVSDRQFLDDLSDLAAAQDGARTVSAAWTWEPHDCPFQ